MEKNIYICVCIFCLENYMSCATCDNHSWSLQNFRVEWPKQNTRVWQRKEHSEEIVKGQVSFLSEEFFVVVVFFFFSRLTTESTPVMDHDYYKHIFISLPFYSRYIFMWRKSNTVSQPTKNRTKSFNTTPVFFEKTFELMRNT